MNKRATLTAAGNLPTLTRPKKPQVTHAGPSVSQEKVSQQGISERNARLIALLDTFEEGDAEEQRRDLTALQIGIDAARPGQRSIFGEGFNP